MISKFISQKLIQATGETEYEREYYEYVVGAFIFQIQEFLTIIILSIFLNTFIYSLVSAMIFSFLRIKIGGYHLKSKTMCWILSTIIILVCGWLWVEFNFFVGFLMIVFVVGILRLMKGS